MTSGKCDRRRRRAAAMECGPEKGKAAVVLICGSLVCYHCAYRNSSLVSLISDVFIVLLCSLAILGMLFRQLNISYPLPPHPFFLSYFC